MAQTGNLSQQYSMDPLPQPKAPEEPQQATPDPRLSNAGQKPEMPPVYYGGKTGSMAYIADRVLTGWLAGTKIANERKHKAMADEVGGAKTGLDYIGAAYRAAQESGDPAKIKQAENALSEAWNDYLNKAEKYALPDQQIDPKTGKPKKEGIGKRLKEGFTGGPPPNIGIAHSTLEVLRKTDPRSMYGQSKAEQQQAKLNDLGISSAERTERDAAAKEKAMDRYQKILTTDPSKRSAEDNKYVDFVENYYFGRSEEQQKRDQLLQKIADGGQLNEGERNLAESFGFIKPKVISSQIMVGRDPKTGGPVNQLVAIGPDGKMVGTPQEIGRAYMPPDQATIAGQMINSQVSALVKLAKKAHPEWDDKTAYQYALASVAAGSGGSGDWFLKNQQADVMNRAIAAVIKNHTHPHTVNGQSVQGYDQIGGFAKDYLVSPGDDGRYYYGSQLGPGAVQTQKHWWGLGKDTQTVGGSTPEQAAQYETQFLAELRAELRKQNPKVSDTDLDKLMPSAMVRRSMQPPPGTAKEQATQNSNEPKTYIVLVNGQSAQRQMTPEQARALQMQGVTISEATPGGAPMGSPLQ